jgi:hypothetical protein
MKLIRTVERLTAIKGQYIGKLERNASVLRVRIPKLTRSVIPERCLPDLQQGTHFQSASDNETFTLLLFA